MTERELINLLKKYKDAPEFGGGFSVEKRDAAWDRLCDQMGWEKNAEPAVYTWKDYLQFYVWKLRAVTLQPLAAGVSLFAIIFGGWVATVNASFDSVPGDVLYPVKLATERVQITFAANPERRARLYSEFAGRRLQEAATVSVSDKEGKEVRVKAAVDGFKTQVNSAQEALKQVSVEDRAGVAVSIDQRSDEFKVSLSQTEASSSENMKPTFQEAKDLVNHTSAEAIRILINTQEETGVDPEVLKQSFKAHVQDLNMRIPLVLGRLLTAEMATKKLLTGDAETKTLGKITAARFDVQLQQGELADALDVFAAGGYGAAFRSLEKISEVLQLAEEILVDVEVTLSTSSTD